MSKTGRLLSLIITIVFALSLSGCWNYVETDRLYMVAGFAIDKGTDGKYYMTAEIVDIEIGARTSKFMSRILSAEGDTLFDAVRNIINISGKKLYWSHAKVAIVSQDIAREGIIQILDLIARDPELRMELRVLVSKEPTANELFSIGSATKIQGFEMDSMLKSQNSLSKAPDIKAYQFINSMSTDKYSEVLPAIGFVDNDGEKILALLGSAIFKKGKLVGFLDEEETKYVLFIRNQIKGGILPEIENGEISRYSISLEIFNNKTKMVPMYSNDEICIDMDIKTTVAVGE